MLQTFFRNVETIDPEAIQQPCSVNFVDDLLLLPVFQSQILLDILFGVTQWDS